MSKSKDKGKGASKKPISGKKSAAPAKSGKKEK